jgi:hypothetical protein
MKHCRIKYFQKRILNKSISTFISCYVESEGRLKNVQTGRDSFSDLKLKHKAQLLSSNLVDEDKSSLLFHFKNNYIKLLFVSIIISFTRLEQFYCTSEFDFQSGLFRRESALTRLWSLIRQGAARPIRT